MDDAALLADLTEPQRDAVLHVDGPLLVLAAAGSGKTRVITRRAARLARLVGPRGVLAITFTNKAADEMRQRIEALGVGRGMLVCTFHALCARLLRQYADFAGLKPNFTIFDQADRLDAIKAALADCDLSAERWKPRQVEQIISRAKNEMQSAEAFAEAARDYVGRTVARVYRCYQQRLAEQSAVDFDDLLLRMADLLHGRSDVRAALEDRFRYVLIDEYQDTNRAQYLIARGLTAERRNLCATGDPDQSIYGWRGADINNILDFEKDYPDAKVVRLEQNYRSTKRILSAADAVIACNYRRKVKRLWTENDDGPAVRVWHCQDEHDEAARIAEDIASYCGAGGAAGDVAIFYRVAALTRVLEDALRRTGLPYQIVRGVEFYNRKEIKDVIAWLRMLTNPADVPACLRAVQSPTRGIGKTTLERLADHAHSRSVSLLDAMEHVDEVPAIKSGRNKVRQFAALWRELAALPPAPVRPVVEAVLNRSGLEAALRGADGAESEEWENVAELVSAAADYDSQNPDGNLVDWLGQISLVGDTDRFDPASGAVTLMTLHAAKGLEFPRVYIAGVEEGLLPHARARTNPESDIEEERRLFFVGMTRAKRQLTLSRAVYRQIRGFSERTLASSFLRELPQEEIEVQDCLGDPDRDEPPSHVDPYDVDERLLTLGRLVRHSDYGLGRISHVEIGRGKPWVRVKFNAYGEKVFALQFAELEVVDH